MNLEEYNTVKSLSYNNYLIYLKNKYGSVPEVYGSSKNRDRDDIKGLFIHHDKENEIAALSSPDNKKLYAEYQKPEYLTYCNYLEHFYLHILIGEQDAGYRDLGLDGAFGWILPALKVYFYKNITNERINPKYYSRIKNCNDVFELLFDRYNKIAGEINILYQHNIKTFELLQDMLNTKGKALLDLGTCGGKTTTALQYIINTVGLALVICPTNTIKNEWNNNDLCEAYTYSGFVANDFYKTINYSKYSAVILDEAHHVGYDKETDTGAKEWVKPINYINENNLCKILGLTATTERSDGIDLANTIFKDCVVKGYTVDEMIKQDILYPFSYITSIYNMDDIVEEVKALYKDGDDTTKKLIGQLDLEKQNTKTTYDILKDYTKQQNITKPKGIIFVSANRKSEEKNTIDEARAIINKAFPEIECRVLYSDTEFMSKEANGCQKNEENKKWFEEQESGFIITINQAGEGWHPKGINLLVMFRKTNSFVVFTQQLGRIMTLKTKNSIDPHAIVFDFVNNINNVYFTGRLMSRTVKEKTGAQKIMRALEMKISSQIIISCEAENFINKYRDLKTYVDDNWEDWEIEILKKYYVVSGREECQKQIDLLWYKNYSYNGISHRSLSAIQSKANSLGLIFRTWLPEEDKILKQYWAIEGLVCSKRLVRHSEQACQQRASFLNLRANSKHSIQNNRWFDNEIEILTKFYPIDGILCKKRLPRHSKMACQQKAQQLGLQATPHATAKKVLCQELNLIYNSVPEAALALNINKSQIYDVLSVKKRAKTAGGYHWKYVD